MYKFHKLTFLILLVFMVFNAKSQYIKPNISSGEKVKKYINTNISKIKSIEPSTSFSTESNWMLSVATIKYHVEHDVPDNELLEKIKKQKNLLKENSKSINYRESNYKNPVTPIVKSGFVANWERYGTPPDNTMAISDDGIIVSAINSNINYYDSDGNKLYGKSFYDFFNDASLTSLLYDPVLTYDAGEDRFIFVVLHGNNSSTSTILIAFSKTDDPLDGWNIYKMKFKDLNSVSYANKWIDFPRVSISNNELYITGNVFYNNEGGYYRAVLIQIDKHDGYNNDNLSHKLWDKIIDADGHIPFTLVPVSYGHHGTIGPGTFLVSNKSAGGSKIYLYELTDDMENNPIVVSYAIPTEEYEVPADAKQYIENQSIDPGRLSLGDCRIMHGFFFDNTIHFVFHSEYNSSGYSGINYNRLNVINKRNESIVIGKDKFDFAFPGVASSSPYLSDEKDVLIGFLISGELTYPGIAAVHVDHEMNPSEHVVLKKGDDYVNIMQGDDRWGDYCGVQRKHNSGAPRVWISGCYGSNVRDFSKIPPIKIDNIYKSWIFEIADNNINDVEEKNLETKNKNTVFPNPVAEIMNIEFTLEQKKNIDISIVDINGKLVKLLYKDQVSKGKTHLSFNKKELESGIYFVVVSSGNEIILKEKILFMN
ncbi:MAG: T9SS type A sorting domain-containing protein [Bacteroidota bacterium]|nr:T9SS type A sorting domain-containing protein [Bacteroidota bacterium]